MRQNLVDLSFAAEAVEDIERALDTLDLRLAELVGLTPRQRRHLTKMGNNSEAFCRQALQLAQQHASLMPRDFDIDGCVRDLEAMDQLFRWRLRIAHLRQRLTDTPTALGSDVMTTTLAIYAVLKAVGAREGVDGEMKELGARFARPSRRGVEEKTRKKENVLPESRLAGTRSAGSTRVFHRRIALRRDGVSSRRDGH
jgi:hypothetical protein